MLQWGYEPSTKHKVTKGPKYHYKTPHEKKDEYAPYTRYASTRDFPLEDDDPDGLEEDLKEVVKRVLKRSPEEQKKLMACRIAGLRRLHRWMQGQKNEMIKKTGEEFAEHTKHLLLRFTMRLLRDTDCANLGPVADYIEYEGRHIP